MGINAPDKGCEPRLYRNRMGLERFCSFIVRYKDSDLWIGIDKTSFSDKIPPFALQQLIVLRNGLEAYIQLQPEFVSSFSPITLRPGAPDIALRMANAGQQAGTGPMAAVAGAFSEYIGQAIIREFRVEEVVVENGGDLFLSLKDDLVMSVYAGNSPLSEKIGVKVPASETPIGVCTSAGTVGPSISFGKADAVMVACYDAALADAFATAIGNRVKTAADVKPSLEICDHEADILSLVVVCEGNLGVKGQFEFKLIK